MKKQQKGISLIMLVITIIVIIILAGAVILNLANNNPISQASKSVFLSDVKNFQTELSLYETQQFADRMGTYDPKLLQADETSVTYNGIVDNTKTINDIITSLGKNIKYTGQFGILEGQLVYYGLDVIKQEWATEAGINVVTIGEISVTIFPPSEIVVNQGTDIEYRVKFISNAAITTIDLTGKIEIVDNDGVTISTQPNITIGTVSGTNLDAIRQVDIIIKTDILINGSYKLKIKARAAIDINNITNIVDTISLTGFDVMDIIPPENPDMSVDISTWTNGNVTVTIVYSQDSTVKQYSFDATNWFDYILPIVVTDNNTTVYARGKDSSGNESGVASLTVANIDKILPTVTASNGGSTSSSITVTAIASDVNGSGINAASYMYSKDNGVTWTTATNLTSYTFNTLTSGTYQCKVKVTDNAGNDAISSAVEITTQALASVTMSASPLTWTNGNVTVTVIYPLDVVTKQYSIDGVTWSSYTVPVVVTANNTTVYAKGLDVGGNQTAQASLTVTNIDKTLPTVTASNGGSTSSSVTVTAVASDINGSGINSASYQYSKDNGVTWTTAMSATNYTFTSLATGTYQCRVKVSDNVGNVAISSAVGITTQALAAVTMSASPLTWTNGNVTVTVTYPLNIVTKQYSLDAVTWNAYTLPVVVTANNTTVYAKGIDAGGNQTAQASLTVTNIDKEQPVITLNGSNPLSVIQNGTYTEPGATVTDNLDLAIQSKLIITGNTFSTSTLGTYNVLYNVTDAAGNVATQKTRVVNVIAPVTATFNYAGSVQNFNVTSSGRYRIECYGSSGGGGALGGYASGEINLTSGQVLYCYVGAIGFNGGLAGSYYAKSNSGGASDVRINGTGLGNRIIVAGGGGGTGNLGNSSGGPGGGTTGGTSTSLGSRKWWNSKCRRFRWPWC